MSLNRQVASHKLRCCRMTQSPQEDAPYVVGRHIVPI
jgi:hypothetical protein